MIGLITSTLASAVRLLHGTNAIVRTQQPEKLLQLYDMEACPYCRPVRECLTELDLDVLIHPCAKGDEAAWKALQNLGGKRQVPFLVDENTNTQLYESKDIVAYLIKTYGTEDAGCTPHTRPLLSTLATGLRLGAGSKHRKSNPPAQPLELFSFEASPFSRPVREALSELGIPYVLRNSGKQQLSDLGVPGIRPTLKPYVPVANSNRARLLERGGKVQFPYLYDPNTDQGMFESKDIVAYLDATYGAH